MTISVGQKSIGMSNLGSVPETLPPIGLDIWEHIRLLNQKLNDIFLVVEGKADANKLRTLIGFSDEAILMQAQHIAFVGEITIAAIVNEQNGSTVGTLPNQVTRIVGPMIQTGSIYSTNWGVDEGTRIDLDNGTITIGGSLAPSFYYDGNGNLLLSGTITAQSLIQTKGKTLGDVADAIDDIISYALSADDLALILETGVGNVLAGVGSDFVLDVNETYIIARHKDANPAGLGGGYAGDLRTGLFVGANGIAMGYNDKTTGNWVNSVAIDGTTGSGSFSGALVAASGSFVGTVSAGAIIAGSVTVNGVQLNVIQTDASDGATHADLTGNPHSTDLTEITGDLDDINDGLVYFRSTANQNTGGSRAFSALDSSNDYIRSLSTTKIAVAGADPGSGWVGDSAGLRGYRAGAMKFNLPTNGTALTFAGDIVTDGQMLSTGGTTSGGYTASIVGAPTSAFNYGVMGIATGVSAGFFVQNGNGAVITGLGQGSGIGLDMQNNSATNAAIKAVNVNASGPSGYFDGDVRMLDDLDVDGDLNVDGAAVIDLTLTVYGATTIDDNATINGALDLNGAIDVSSTADVHGAAHFYSSIEIDGTATFDGLIVKSEVSTHRLTVYDTSGTPIGTYRYAFHSA